MALLTLELVMNRSDMVMSLRINWVVMRRQSRGIENLMSDWKPFQAFFYLNLVFLEGDRSVANAIVLRLSDGALNA